MSPARTAMSVQGPHQHQETLAALHAAELPAPMQDPVKHSNGSQKQRQRLSLRTSFPSLVPAPVPEEAEEEAAEEEMQDVIAMSPAVRTNNGFTRYRQSARLSQIMSPGTARSSQVSLSMSQFAKDTPVFGQRINPNDLVATGIENAFTRLGV